MDKLLEIFSEHYLIFLIASVVLILALIGYILEHKSDKDIKIKHANKKAHQSVNLQSSSDNIEQL